MVDARRARLACIVGLAGCRPDNDHTDDETASRAGAPMRVDTSVGVGGHRRSGSAHRTAVAARRGRPVPVVWQFGHPFFMPSNAFFHAQQWVASRVVAK
jgi:hypothetical protein